MSNKMAEDPRVISPDELDFNKFSFGEIIEIKKKDGNNRLTVPLLYEGERNYVIQTGLGKSPFGPSVYNDGSLTDSDLKTKKRSLKQHVSKHFSDQMTILRNKTIEFCVENSKIITSGRADGQGGRDKKRDAWEDSVQKFVEIGKINTKSGETIPDNVDFSIYPDNSDKTRPSPIKIYYPGVFDEDGEPKEHIASSWEELSELIPSNCSTNIVFALSPWFVGKKFGIAMSVQQILVVKPKTKKSSQLNKCAFNMETVEKSIPDSVEEPEEEEQEEIVEKEAEVVDSDKEEEEEEEEEEEPEPPKKVVKPAPKKVVKPASRK